MPKFHYSKFIHISSVYLNTLQMNGKHPFHTSLQLLKINIPAVQSPKEILIFMNVRYIVSLCPVNSTKKTTPNSQNIVPVIKSLAVDGVEPHNAWLSQYRWLPPSVTHLNTSCLTTFYDLIMDKNSIFVNIFVIGFVFAQVKLLESMRCKGYLSINRVERFRVISRPMLSSRAYLRCSNFEFTRIDRGWCMYSWVSTRNTFRSTTTLLSRNHLHLPLPNLRCVSFTQDIKFNC